MTTSAGSSGERKIRELSTGILSCSGHPYKMREWAIKRSSIASLLSILDAPFDVVRSECTTVADRVSTFLSSGEMIDLIFTYGMFLGALLV